MRKHCTRCGASFLKTEEDLKPKPSAPNTEFGRVVTGSTLEEPEEIQNQEPVPVDYEEGKEVVKQILERVKAAETRTKDEEAALQPETDIEVV